MVALDDYRTLGRSGLRVSPLCLGAMTFGEDWGWGANAQDSRRMFDMYADRGGNFVDTADGCVFRFTVVDRIYSRVKDSPRRRKIRLSNTQRSHCHSIGFHLFHQRKYFHGLGYFDGCNERINCDFRRFYGHLTM